MHHLDNLGHFKAEPSHLTTGMVLRMPAHLADMWQQNLML